MPESWHLSSKTQMRVRSIQRQQSVGRVGAVNRRVVVVRESGRQARVGREERGGGLHEGGVGLEPEAVQLAGQRADLRVRETRMAVRSRPVGRPGKVSGPSCIYSSPKP